MALTGLDIFKLLPKTNCKKCGMPTCLAFAMQLAQKRAELDACPCVSEEAKNKLDAAAAPPVKLIKLDRKRFCSGMKKSFTIPRSWPPLFQTAFRERS
ncbi:MAG: (Fe-S)-binding protein [Planctomycetota bacterium]